VIMRGIIHRPRRPQSARRASLESWRCSIRTGRACISRGRQRDAPRITMAENRTRTAPHS